MPKNSKAKSRLDKFYHLAKEQGYRSRAAFKLIQLDKKFRFFSECRTSIDGQDLGGWTQVAAKNLPVSSRVIAVDLIAIKPIRGATTIVADITTEKCKKLIERESNGELFDIVLNDGAPNVGGAWHSESLSQAILVLDALKLATHFLAPNGWFITKVFRSKDYNALLYACNELFGKVEATKPTASRGSSAEIFLVCQKYKAPGKIDPKLLDARHVLQEFSSGSKARMPEAMLKKQGKKLHRRHREGYEEGMSTTFKSTSIMTFVKAEDPVQALGLYTQFRFEAEESSAEETEKAEMEFCAVRDHPKTTEEIKSACEDLLLLGKKEFKKLLKWRLIVSKEIKVQNESESEVKETKPIDPEEEMLKEISMIQQRIMQKAKKKEKKRREMKKHAKKRLAQLNQSEGMVEETINDPSLFGLGLLKDSKEVGEEFLNAADADSGESSEMEEDDGSEDDELKYEALVEDYLEKSYQRYLRRKGDDDDLEDPVLVRRKRLEDKDELASVEDDGGVAIEGDCEVELDEDGTGVAATPEAISQQWFSQDIFEDVMDIDDAVEETQPEAIPVAEDTERADVEEEMDEEEESDFEIVKLDQPKDGSGTDTEDEFRMLDVDGKAEIIAMARKMLRRKEKESIVDAAYSKYVFHDKNLPKWFEHDNDVHNRPQRMVTREEIEAEKEVLRAMDSRPIKKVAEAKSRKAKRMANRLKTAIKRAEGISNQDELPYGTKMRQMAKLLSKAKKKENQKFVSKDQLKRMGRSKKLSAVKKMPRVDKRLKSDKRLRRMGREGKNLKAIKSRKAAEKQKRAISKSNKR